MIYQGRELVELKFDTMQHWPDGRELLVWDSEVLYATVKTMFAFVPKHEYPFIGIDNRWLHAAELPTVTKRRVKRCECAGMAVQLDDMSWESAYRLIATVKQWEEPMPENYINRALTLADALAGRTLGMEVEG